MFKKMTVLDEREHVFIVGSPRSGTSLVASILQDSPVYASYRAETKFLAGCEEKYGDLEIGAVRTKFWGDWLKSRQFKRSGLTKEEVRLVADEERSYIGILARIMNLVATKQGIERWIDSTPENSHRLKEISKSFPKAKIVHIIRDGRAVSLSLAKLGWSGISTRNYNKALYYSSLKWQQSVETVLESSKYLGDRYFEMRYEELVQDPLNVVKELCAFLRIPMLEGGLLDHEFNKNNEDSKSTLHTPNTPFGDMSSGISSNAAFRWKDVLKIEQICKIEAHIARTLIKLNYSLICNAEVPLLYGLLPVSRKYFLVLKRVVKKHTLIGRYSTSPFEFEPD
jgi:hypothetical protein